MSLLLLLESLCYLMCMLLMKKSCIYIYIFKLQSKSAPCQSEGVVLKRLGTGKCDFGNFASPHPQPHPDTSEDVGIDAKNMKKRSHN